MSDADVEYGGVGAIMRDSSGRVLATAALQLQHVQGVEQAELLGVLLAEK